MAQDWPVDWSAPIANRNFLIHQYEEINRELTWDTLSTSFRPWYDSLHTFVADASALIEGEDGPGAPSDFPDGI